MNIKLASSTLLLFTGMLLVGCSDSDPKSPVSLRSASSTVNSDPVAQGMEKYDGSYIIPCQLSGEDIGDAEDSEDTIVVSTYSYQTMTIQDSKVNLTSLFYADEDCTVPFENGDEEKSTYGLYFTGGQTQTSRGAADHVDVTFESLLVNGVAPPPAYDDTDIGKVIYDIILLDGAALYVGKGDVGEDENGEEISGSTPEHRHTELDDLTIIRQ